ncbi:11515_t:CDS:2 [Funneliformis mosseae]|uniref:11515_t:CDS:1 n=1 Tax=Funneliformis mosseae TaxID=27381 RepID=A0A9N9HF90_FUNMO|nr:11515_t:CDS:2 [Funneliformis mosseae]
MIYYDGAYLVDEIVSFTIPDTPTQLCLLKDIVTGLLSFRARVEHTYTQITNLLKSATSRRRPRRMKTDIDVSPGTSKTLKKKKIVLLVIENILVVFSTTEIFSKELEPIFIS